MASTISLVPIQALTSINNNGVQMTGPFILVRTNTTVAQQVNAQRRLKKQEPTKDASQPGMLRCKRRTDGKGLHHLLPKPQPATVARRNERERNRVKMVNLGFETLREHVPDGKKNKKLSKVDTLKSAVEYIRQLQQLLEYTDGDNTENDLNITQMTDNNDEQSATPDSPAQNRSQTTCDNFQSDKENYPSENLYQNNNTEYYNHNHDYIKDGVINYRNIDGETDSSRLTYHQLQTFNYQESVTCYNNDNVMSYDTGSTNSGYSSDQYQYTYSPMKNSPATSYLSMQHSPSTSENLSESFSSEEDELPDLKSFFPL